MKKLGVIIFAAALIIGLVVSNLFSFGRLSDSLFHVSFNFKGVKGSGNMATENRSVSNFKGVDVSGVFQVEITAQKEFGVEVEADDNLLPYISTEVRDGVLHIETERKINTGNPLRVRISAPDINKLETSGATNVTISDLKNSGIAIDSSGASKIDAADLTAEAANIDASGASCVSVNVTGTLRSEASGASKVTYTGSPSEVIKKTNGAGSVSPK
jgi:hypothetical protein